MVFFLPLYARKLAAHPALVAVGKVTSRVTSHAVSGFYHLYCFGYLHNLSIISLFKILKIRFAESSLTV